MSIDPQGQPNSGFTTPKLYDFFSADDLSLFRFSPCALSPATLQSLNDEVGGDP